MPGLDYYYTTRLSLSGIVRRCEACLGWQWGRCGYVGGRGRIGGGMVMGRCVMGRVKCGQRSRTEKMMADSVCICNNFPDLLTGPIYSQTMRMSHYLLYPCCG